MDKIVLVTGGAKGIGRAIVQEFASLGYTVVINYLSSEVKALELSTSLNNLGYKTIAYKADVSKEDEVNNMFDYIEKTLGFVDILINNAAVDLSELFQRKKLEDFKRTFDVNVIGCYLTARRAYKPMLNKKWGRIINISSTNGMNTYYPVTLEYDASKAALNSLTHNLAIQFAPYITVNAIAPGFIGTESELEGYDDEFMKQELEKILVGRFGDPKEVAHLAKFLASDEAAYINNSIIRIDGGQYGA